MISALPPAGKATTSLTGRDGKLSAAALREDAAAATIATAPESNLRLAYTLHPPFVVPGGR
jgi:hypothetical protein